MSCFPSAFTCQITTRKTENFSITLEFSLKCRKSSSIFTKIPTMTPFTQARLMRLSPPPAVAGTKLQSWQIPFNCRRCDKELLKFDITKSQLMVCWSEWHSKTEPLGALAIVQWWNIPAVPISLSSQKGLCISCLNISACGATLSIFSRVKEAVKIAKATLQQPTFLYPPKSAISVYTCGVF